jgi:hypothetical protein
MLVDNQQVLLSYLKAKFPVFHKSNFFFRDLQYGIRSFFETKDINISYTEAEELAIAVADHFEKKEIFIKINEKAWTVNHSDFVTTEPGDPL